MLEMLYNLKGAVMDLLYLLLVQTKICLALHLLGGADATQV